MAYLPKQKIQFLNTAGGELVYKSTNKKYVGDYMETSKGKFFVGKNISALGPELLKPKTTTVNFGSGEDFNSYKKLKPKTYSRISKTKAIPTTKNTPDEKDYEKGYYNRYFIQKLNENYSYQEVDRTTYSDIKSNSKKYDFNLYISDFIVWSVKGENCKKTNNLTLKRKEKKYTYLSLIFPILDEFKEEDKGDSIPINSLGYTYPSGGGGSTSGGGGGGY
jgi:hypothetical protein